MKKNILTTLSNINNTLQQKSLGFLFSVILVLVFGFTSKINAQCIGPYQTFESFTTAATPTSWSLNTGVTAFTTV